MALSAKELDAFHAVAESGGFGKAAKRLGVTQPALSQRIQQLEGELKRRLFVRSAAGVVMTEAGARLLRYCDAKRAMESEVLEDLAVVEGPGGELSGTIGVASFSSVGRSCVLPALAGLFRENPRLIIDFAVREIHELVIGSQGSAGIVLLDHVVPRPDVEAIPLGFEEYVLVESKKHRSRDDVYLDHDPDDTTTLKFLGKNNVKTRYVRRSFFDDIYGVLDGAAAGYGRAVVPKHLLVGEYHESLRVVPDMRTSRSPVVMHHFRQPSYTRAHESVTRALKEEMPQLLSGKKRR